jgi:hypothetical protein
MFSEVLTVGDFTLIPIEIRGLSGSSSLVLNQNFGAISI